MDETSRILNELVSASKALLNLQRMTLFNLSEALRLQLLSTARNREPLRLLPFGYKVYSQNDEDGIIAEIYRRIGFGSKTFLEFGVEGGLENNTCLLLMQGWKGAWIEGSAKHCTSIASAFKAHIDAGRLQVLNEFVSAENINDLIGCLQNPDVDFLSVDIDGNDYWVWRAIESARPRVVAIEYNAIFPPTHEWIQRYDPNHRYDGTSYHGAGLKSFETLGRAKGYTLVGCNINGVNAFFVRNDLVWQSGEPFFCSPFSAENHYEPFRHPYLKVPTTKRMSPRAGHSPQTEEIDA